MISNTLYIKEEQFDGLVEECSNSIANALELPQSCTEPSSYFQFYGINAAGADDTNEGLEYLWKFFIYVMAAEDLPTYVLRSLAGMILRKYSFSSHEKIVQLTLPDFSATMMWTLLYWQVFLLLSKL